MSPPRLPPPFFPQLDELPGNLILTNRTIRKVALALSAGGGQKELRATPTRMLAGRATKRVFGSLAVENALAARMNATDLELGQHMPHAVPLTRLPYALYMVGVSRGAVGGWAEAECWPALLSDGLVAVQWEGVQWVGAFRDYKRGALSCMLLEKSLKLPQLFRQQR